jgi:hypothetical protein
MSHHPTPAARRREIATARAADERIAAAWALYWDAVAPANALARELGEQRKRLRGAQRRAARPGLTAAAQAEADQYVGACEVSIAQTEAEIARIRDAAALLADVARALDAELYTGWQRFFLVEHIHASQHCSSFRASTRISWLPAVSGLTEAEAVAEYGAILCTICFPSAPVEWTNGEAKATDGRCPGSGKPIDRSLPHRSGFYAGNWATCPECERHVGVTRTALRIPKHQPTKA